MTEITTLHEHARNIRRNVVRMTHAAGSGHPGGSLGMADVFAALYFRVMCFRPENPLWEGRDRFILSNGHICPVWYATLAECGAIPKEELLTLRKLGSRLQGHPANVDFPLAELATGSLGQGFPASVGLALANRLNHREGRVFVSLGDGELQEGSCWEAFMAAAHYKLGNLTAFIDRNGQQQAGRTEEMLALEPLADKLRAFGWHVIEADGHDIGRILEAFRAASETGPNVIIFRTVMGKGVSFMEHNFEWHGTVPSDEQLKRALEELA